MYFPRLFKYIYIYIISYSIVQLDTAFKCKDYITKTCVKIKYLNYVTRTLSFILLYYYI